MAYRRRRRQCELTDRLHEALARGEAEQELDQFRRRQQEVRARVGVAEGAILVEELYHRREEGTSLGLPLPYHGLGIRRNGGRWWQWWVHPESQACAL